MNHFKRYFLVYTLLPLIILSLAASFYRFMVSYDYEVTHEGYCDPYTEQCFMYCENDECSEPFYYTTVSRQADSLISLCGDSLVSECDNAQFCQPDEQSCFITFCTPDGEVPCEDLNIRDMSDEREETVETAPNYTDI